MRSARQRIKLALALTLLLAPGSGRAAALGRTVVPGRGRVVAFEPAFWYPYSGFGWGLSSWYGPPLYGGYAPIQPRNAAPVELHVRPRRSEVIIDGSNVGQARDFNSRAYPLWLKAGTHTLELSRPGYETLRLTFEVKRGRAYRVHYELREGEGLDPRSSKRPQEPRAEPRSE